MQSPAATETQENQMAFLNSNRYELQENAVFLNYERAELLNNITNYKSLNIYTRTALAKNIDSIQTICCKDLAYTHFLNCMAEDCEEIQTELIRFLQKSFLQGREEVEYHREFINPLITLIKGTHLEIKEESCALISQVVHRMSGEERKEVMRLAEELQKGSDEEGKIVAIQLISKLTADLSQQQAEKYFKHDYINLYNSSSVRVKKQIIQNLTELSHHVSLSFFEKEILGKFFMERTREHVWGIRKVCVEKLAELVELTQGKKEVLANLLHNFTMDGNKLVKIAAYKMVPEFLARYGGKNAPEQLLGVFLGLLDNEINQYVNRQDEIVERVAFYFPGVLQTYGAARWSKFSGLFNRLLRSKKDQIKIPIASSLHQICKILGHDIAKDCMFQALDSVLKQHSQVIKTAAIAHFSDFVEVFTPQTRENLIDVFLVIQNDNKKWRVRHEIARQLKHLTRIYDTQIVFRFIFPIGMKLVSDSVSEVRFQAAQHMYDIISKFKDNDQYENMALLSIKSLCTSERHLQRLAFAYLIRFLYPLRLFAELIVPALEELSRDPAAIVRHALALSIHYIIQHSPSSSAQFSSLMVTFQRDQGGISQVFA